MIKTAYEDKWLIEITIINFLGVRTVKLYASNTRANARAFVKNTINHYKTSDAITDRTTKVTGKIRSTKGIF